MYTVGRQELAVQKSTNTLIVTRGRGMDKERAVAMLPGEFLTVGGGATLPKLRPATLYRWCRAERLTSTTIGEQ